MPLPRPRQLRSRGRDAALRAIKAAGPRLGHDVLARSYYSPIPNLEELAPAFWETPSEMVGVDLRIEAAFTLLEGPLASHIAAFDPPSDPAPGRLFHLANRTYETVDAEVLFALIRHLRPRRIVELGSGASSAVILEALGEEPAGYRVFDPYPREHWARIIREHVAIEEIGAADVPTDVVTDLEAGDVLFIDTTHIVRAGGDVTHIFNELVPRVAPGVVVHVHDIFLPHPYPEEWYRDDQRYFTEQYLLQAFLAFNEAFEVLAPLHAMVRAQPERMAACIPSFRPRSAGAFWMRRRLG